MTVETTREYMTEVFLKLNSKILGLTPAELPPEMKKVRLLQLVRGEEMHFAPFKGIRFEVVGVLDVARGNGVERVGIELAQQGRRSRS